MNNSNTSNSNTSNQGQPRFSYVMPQHSMQQWQVGPVPDNIYFQGQHQNDLHAPPHSYQQDMSRRNERMDFPGYGQPQPGGQHHSAVPQPPMSVSQSPSGPPPTQAPPQQAAPTQTTGRRGKRSQPHQPVQHQQPQHHQQQQQQQPQPQPPQPQHQPQHQAPAPPPVPAATAAPSAPATPAQAPSQTPAPAATPAPAPKEEPAATPANPPPAKKSRTNTPWTPAEELRLKQMRDAGKSWAEIAKTFPTRTEGSVKKHWYKDMHYAEFAEDESQALLTAIKEYENNKWKTIGQKVGKPAKACEQYAKEHFPELFGQSKQR